MALRTFVDSDGREWEAFDVVPRADERRSYARRSRGIDADLDAEKRECDRRFTVGGRSALATNVNEGWLCFARGCERRRLSPIPADWQRSSDAELEAFRREARPVRDAVSEAAG